MYTTTTLVLYGLRPYSIINLIVSAKAVINLIITAATSLLFTVRSIVHHTFPLYICPLDIEYINMNVNYQS